MENEILHKLNKDLKMQLDEYKNGECEYRQLEIENEILHIKLKYMKPLLEKYKLIELTQKIEQLPNILQDKILSYNVEHRNKMNIVFKELYKYYHNYIEEFDCDNVENGCNKKFTKASCYNDTYGEFCSDYCIFAYRQCRRRYG